MAAKKILNLTFKNGAGKNVKITINKPKTDLASATVSEIMQNIIDSNALSEGAALQTKVSAEYVVQTTEAFTL